MHVFRFSYFSRTQAASMLLWRQGIDAPVNRGGVCVPVFGGSGWTQLCMVQEHQSQLRL